MATPFCGACHQPTECDSPVFRWQAGRWSASHDSIVFDEKTWELFVGLAQVVAVRCAHSGIFSVSETSRMSCGLHSERVWFWFGVFGNTVCSSFLTQAPLPIGFWRCIHSVVPRTPSQRLFVRALMAWFLGSNVAVIVVILCLCSRALAAQGAHARSISVPHRFDVDVGDLIVVLWLYSHQAELFVCSWFLAIRICRCLTWLVVAMPKRASKVWIVWSSSSILSSLSILKGGVMACRRYSYAWEKAVFCWNCVEWVSSLNCSWM